MGLLKQNDPWEREFTEVWRREQWFLRRYEKEKEPALTRKIQEREPDQLRELLERTFLKAFRLLVRQGDDWICRPEGRVRRQACYERHAAAVQDREDRRNLRAFPKSAKRTGRGRILLSGAAGAGMGVLGIALPDLMLLTGNLLKTSYEIGESFGFSWEGEEERIYVLRLLETSLSHGEKLREQSRALDLYAQEGHFPEARSLEYQMERTAQQLAGAILAEKAIQNVPILGIVGGLWDAVCLRRVRSFAQIKYQKRFLLTQRLGQQ